jgi:hypothetical protein
VSEIPHSESLSQTMSDCAPSSWRFTLSAE